MSMGLQSNNHTGERYQLGISQNNLPHWGALESLKEFIQNNVFAKTILKDTTRIMHDGQYAIIRNFPSGFSKGKLLVGESEQRGVAGAPGDYGEGTKVAMLVARRLGRDCWIETNGFTIRPELEPSEIDAEVNVLTYYLEDTDNHEGTTVYLECTREELDKAMESFAVLQGANEEDLSKDSILDDEDVAGGIFVNGVLITKVDGVFGYNFTNSDIKNRDRNMADMAAVRKSVSKMLANITREQAHRVLKAVLKDPSLLESEAGLDYWQLTSSTTELWKGVVKQTLGSKVAIAAGGAEDTLAMYKGFKLLVDVPQAWQPALTRLGVPRTYEIEGLVPKPKRVHRKPCAEDSVTLGWAKRLIGQYYAPYGTVKVTQDLHDEYDNKCDGIYDHETGITWLDAEILCNKEKTFKTLLHETVHRETGYSDCTVGFERALEHAAWMILTRGKGE